MLEGGTVEHGSGVEVGEGGTEIWAGIGGLLGGKRVGGAGGLKVCLLPPFNSWYFPISNSQSAVFIVVGTFKGDVGGTREPNSDRVWAERLREGLRGEGFRGVNGKRWGEGLYILLFITFLNCCVCVIFINIISIVSCIDSCMVSKLVNAERHRRSIFILMLYFIYL